MLILKSTNTVDISAVILLDLSFENWEADWSFEKGWHHLYFIFALTGEWQC